MKQQSTSKNISARVFFKRSKISLWTVHYTVHFSNKFSLVNKLLGKIQLSYQCDWQYTGITVRKCHFVQGWQNITDRNSYKCQRVVYNTNFSHVIYEIYKSTCIVCSVIWIIFSSDLKTRQHWRQSRLIRMQIKHMYHTSWSECLLYYSNSKQLIGHFFISLSVLTMPLFTWLTPDIYKRKWLDFMICTQ